jgi:hypothetical protein
MKILLLTITILFSSVAVSADRYSCIPVSGKENFKNSDLYFIDYEGRRATLIDAHNKENSWDFDIFYSHKDYGFRAVRSIRKGSEPLASMTSIAIGGTLYFMSFEEGSRVALVTYENAIKENDAGSMRLKCTK